LCAPEGKGRKEPIITGRPLLVVSTARGKGSKGFNLCLKRGKKAKAGGTYGKIPPVKNQGDGMVDKRGKKARHASRG